jgi:hypothetical protein
MNKMTFPMNPREPLTEKAESAISKYAIIKSETGKKLNYHYFMVKYVLAAERMRRADLYEWLENKGYRWLPKHGFWEKQK